MKANLKTIRKQRRYSEEFKRSLVKDFESGKYSVVELSELHGVGNPSIYDWIYRYSTINKKGYRVVEQKVSSVKKVKGLQREIKELQAALGRKQIEVDFLTTLIDLANEEFGVDIKKNFSTQQSNISKSSK